MELSQEEIEARAAAAADTIEEQAPVSGSEKFPRPEHYVREGSIDCWYGPLNDTDYGWHFSPWHAQRSFGASLDMPLRIIKTYLDEKIPDTLEVKVDLPSPDWEKQLITVRVLNGRKAWNFDEGAVNAALPELLARLNKHIEDIAKRRPKRAL